MTATAEAIQRSPADQLAIERPALATVLEGARYLHVSRSKLYEMMDSGMVPWVKLGGSRRLRWSDLEKLVADNLVGGVDG